MKKNLVIYDGNCRLCKMFSKMIVSPHFEFNPNNNTDELIYIENDEIYKGFYAVRRIALKIPYFWIFLPILYFPFFDRIGTKIYKFISRYRKWI
jgi:Protein of unknown function, DUF393.